MTATKSSKLKKISLILKWGGASLFFVSILGFFNYPERVQFYEELQYRKEMSADSQVAQKLMKNFGFPEEQIKFIEKIILIDLRFGKMGRSIAGKAVAVAKDGRQRTISDLIEIRSWAHAKSRVYDWIAFSLIFSGLLIDSFILFCLEKIKQ